MEELKKAFALGITRPYQFRLAQLSALRNLLRENKQTLIESLIADFKCPNEAEIEVLSCISACSSAMINLDGWMRPERKSCPFPFKLLDSAYVQWEPKGVVLIIGAWNFPLILLIEPFVGAIAAGCTVMLKPSELAPKTAELLARLIVSYLDTRAFSVVLGDGEVCAELVRSPLLNHILFTGSTQVGRLVYAEAAKNLTPVTLELGGKNPVIFTAKADEKSAVKRIVWGRFHNAGQACIAPEYVLFTEPLAKQRLEQAFVEATQKMHGTGEFLSKCPTEKHAERIREIVAQIPKEWIIYNGNSFENSDKRKVYPVVVSVPSWKQAQELRMMQEEIFGPVLMLVQVNSLSEAISLVNEQPKPLACYLFTKDKREIERVIGETSSGGVCVNDTLMQFTNENLPFGGVGASGIGAYHGKYSFETFSHPKAVLSRSTKDEFANEKFRYPPASLNSMLAKMLYRE
jgi:aldehyde dehydrogenase (NAD+)